MTRGWKIALGWVKAHAGNWGNEVVDKLAKKAAINKTIPESYSKIPKSVTINEIEEESLRKWQKIWTQITKGKTTKEYFPEVTERLTMKLHLTQNLRAILSGHGKSKEYLHHYKIIGDPTCPCGEGAQTTEHVIYGARDYLKREKE